MAERKVIVQPGQVLEDIALQEYGSVDGVVSLVTQNRAVLSEGFSSLLTPGMELSIVDEPMNIPVHNAMRSLSITPSTGDLGVEVTPLGPGGDYNMDHSADHKIH